MAQTSWNLGNAGAGATARLVISDEIVTNYDWRGCNASVTAAGQEIAVELAGQTSSRRRGFGSEAPSSSRRMPNIATHPAEIANRANPTQFT